MQGFPVSRMTQNMSSPWDKEICMTWNVSLWMGDLECVHPQCVTVCCSVLQCDAVCLSGLVIQIVRIHRILKCVAVCCSVLQCVAVCCSVLQCVAVCCSVLQCVTVDVWFSECVHPWYVAVCSVCYSVLWWMRNSECVYPQCIAECWSFTNASSVYCSVSQTLHLCIAACCSVLQRVVACYSVLQWDLMRCNKSSSTHSIRNVFPDKLQ